MDGHGKRCGHTALKGARAKFELEIHSNAKTTCLSQGFIIGSTEVDDDHGAWIFFFFF